MTFTRQARKLAGMFGRRALKLKLPPEKPSPFEAKWRAMLAAPSIEIDLDDL